MRRATFGIVKTNYVVLDLSGDNIVNVGWVSLSKSGKSLSIRVANQMFFIPLRDLYQVLDGKRARAELKQWIQQKMIC